MNHPLRLPFLGLAALALCLSSASAIPITPTGTSFGSLSVATFNGSGIPNDAVQQWTDGTLTLGLTATQRYTNPPLTNNGAGTFFADAGGDILEGKPGYAKWNFDFYVAGVTNGVTTKLFFDNNPAVGNDVSTFIPFLSATGQDSWNLGMAFLGGAGFNPGADGEYGFALVAYNVDGIELGRSAIRVDVGNVSSSVPDGGSSVLMLGSVLAVLGLLRRRFVK